MPTPRKPPRRTRERILDTALALFNEAGEPQVSTTAIADALNISAGNLYYHFRNKDDIVEALFARFADEIGPLLALPQAAEAEVEDAWLFLHLLFETLWRHRFIYRDLAGLTARSRKIARGMPRVLDAKTDAAKRLCRGLVARGVMRASPPEIDALAVNMVVVCTGWMQFDTVSHPTQTPTQARLERGAFQVLALTAAFLDGDGRRLIERLAIDYLEH